MHPSLRLVLFVIVGFIGGSVANMLVLQVGTFIVPPPPGTNVNTSEGLNASMALMAPLNFLFPFLAHAVGTLVGSYVATRWGKPGFLLPAMVVATLFLLGGIIMVMLVPNTPTWFAALDLVCAYLPMGYLAYVVAKR